MRWLGVIFLAGMLLVGCSTDEQTLQLIELAEQVMIDHPDSALRVIRSVDTETIRGEEDMAHYRLAMAEAMYYNRLTPNRDSIAQPLFDYYLKSDDHAMRARAMYQHALVMQSDGENAKAMYSLLEAEKSLEHVDNPRLAGLVHRTKGDVYHNECLFSLSLDEHQKAKEMFDKAGLESHSLYALYNIAVAQTSLRNFRESIETLLEIERQTRLIEDDFLQYMALVDLCFNYIEIGEYESCLSTFPLIDASYYEGYNVCDYYCIGAVLNAYKGDNQGAEEWLSIAKEQPDRYQVRLSYAEYIVNVFQGNSDKALETYTSMIAVQDKNVFNLINNSLLQSQVDLLSKKIEHAEELQSKNKMLYLLIATIVVIVIAVLVLIILYRHRKYKNDIRHYIETIENFQLVTKSSSSELDSVIEALYRQSLNEINELCEIYYEQAGSSRLASKVVEQVEKNIDRLKNDKRRMAELESAVNVSSNDIMHRLREQCPDLCERDMRIALYTYAGFSNRAISLLVGCSSDAVPKFKYGIREQIKRSQAEDESMLIEPLYNKRSSKSNN